jgi:biotin carboxylase
MNDVTKALSWFLRSRKIDRIICLDDFDVEKGAALREHFRIPGMGQTTSRYFRDKLAMRMKAQEAGIPVPAFTALFHDSDINDYLERTKAPWLIKPRGEASATGIRKADSNAEVWRILNELGDTRHDFLMEQFRTGDVFHADSLTLDKKVIFCRVSQYLNTPMEVAHTGGIFRTATIPLNTETDTRLHVLTQRVMTNFGMLYGASHTEFIKDPMTGEFFFLETSARVGGAHIAELVEAASGINLWAEWARMEVAMARKQKYRLPPIQEDHAGILISLCRVAQPNMTNFNDAEIVWRLDLDHHIGMVVRSAMQPRILELLEDYAGRVLTDFHASAPVPEKSNH